MRCLGSSKRVDQSVTLNVDNLSIFSLSESQMSVLNRGLNFSITPSFVPRRDIVTGVECAIKHLSYEDKCVVRNEVSGILKSAKKPKPNLSDDELDAIAQLRANTDIIILPADKGNKFVTMNKDDYLTKFLKLVSTNPSIKILDNLTAKSSILYFEKWKSMVV